VQLNDQPPELSFSLSQDCIVIDSNEDAFSETNIKAICSISESAKTCKQGYVGEKGIRFKSVFKVARKVLVQSESFSLLQNDINELLMETQAACAPRRWRVFGTRQSHGCLSQLSTTMSVSSKLCSLYHCRAEHGPVPSIQLSIFLLQRVLKYRLISNYPL